MTTTLKERFGQRFPNNIAEVIDDFGSTTKSDLLAFFRQELLALAEEVEDSSPLDEGFNKANQEAAALIRAKADELK